MHGTGPEVAIYRTLLVAERLLQKILALDNRMIMKKDCPFCFLISSRIVSETESMVLIRDAFPVTKGHLLIIPKRHVISFFDLQSKELQDVLKLLHEAKGLLDSLSHPDGYNIGINDGAAAGQTMEHLHIHLIPRYEGDSPDPRGGIRWVIPEKAKYWK